MNHISRLNCRIRVVGQAEAAYHLGTRLEADIRQRVAEAYSAALDQAFEGDPTVYVMRALDLHLELALSDQNTWKFVRQVAGRMAKEARRNALVNDETVRFEDESDYLAHFIADVLRGQAWDSWLYGPFRKFKSLPLQQLLRKVLLDDPQILAETLARLTGLGLLDQLLATLPRTAQIEVWDRMYSPGRQNEEELPEIWRPFYAAALTLLDRLELKRIDPPSLESILHNLPDRFFAKIDWRDRQALASAVMEILFLLSRRGYVRSQQEFFLDEQEKLSSLNEALQPLDWLDQDYLRKELLNWFSSLSQTQSRLPLGSRPAVATPRQAKCLEDLLATVQTYHLNLNSLQLGSPENAIRLLTALYANVAHWQNDSLPPRLVDLLLAAWESLSQAYEPAQVLQALQQANLAKALQYLPQTPRDKAQKQFKELLGLGPTATTILTLISKSEAPSAGSFPSVERRCAGVALLLRAVLDAHLPSLLSRSDFPDPALTPEQRLQAVLLRCFEAWAGTDSGSDELKASLDTSVIPAEPEPEYDVGFLLLAGIDPEAEPIHLPRTFSLSDLSSFRQTWEEHLAGLRLTATGNMADDLLRLWARWLRGFADSSVPFLLEKFIRRPGYLSITPTEIKVEMERRSLDMVLEMADYLAPIENISWLGDRRLSFTVAPDS